MKFPNLKICLGDEVEPKELEKLWKLNPNSFNSISWYGEDFDYNSLLTLRETCFLEAKARRIQYLQSDELIDISNEMPEEIVYIDYDEELEFLAMFCKLQLIKHESMHIEGSSIDEDRRAKLIQILI